jgi:hypothetical protein
VWAYASPLPKRRRHCHEIRRYRRLKQGVGLWKSIVSFRIRVNRCSNNVFIYLKNTCQTTVGNTIAIV